MKKFSDSELDKKLEKYPEWQLDDESGKLTTGFEFESFEQAIDFANVAADIAEDLDHHPDILIHDYKYVTLFLSTHDIDGISEKDFEFIESLEEELTESEDE